MKDFVLSFQPTPNTIETSSCMRNRGLKRPAPSEILLSGTVSKEEEEWPIPECHVTHWKVLKCPTTSKSGWQNLSWNYQKVNIKTTLYIFIPTIGQEFPARRCTPLDLIIQFAARVMCDASSFIHVLVLVNLSGDLERVQWCTKRMTHSHTFCVVV